MDDKASKEYLHEAFVRPLLFDWLVESLLEIVFYDSALNKNVLIYGEGKTKSTPIDFVVRTLNDTCVLIEAIDSYKADSTKIWELTAWLRNSANQLPEKANIDRIILAIATDLPSNGKQLLLEEKEYYRSKNISFELWEASHIRNLIKAEFGLELASFSTEDLEDFLYDSQKEIDRVIELKRSANLKPPSKFILRGELKSKEYKSVIVITADFCSYTRFVNASGHDKELVISVMSRFYEEVSKTIDDHQAVLDKFMGDGVLFYWIVKNSFAGVAEVVDACIGSLIGLSLKLAEEWQEHIDQFVDVKGMRCGGAIGEVLFITEKLLGDASFHAIGDCINLAARLQATAPPNHLVVSNTVKTKVFKEDASFEDISPLEVKNIGNVKAWKKSYK